MDLFYHLKWRDISWLAQDIKLALLWFAVFAMLARGKDFWREAAFGPVHSALSVTQSD
jgi:hypothetical protein